MKLDAFFDRIGPFLEGRASEAETLEALYGGGDPVDARRLGIYARFCRIHRLEVVEHLYAECRGVVVGRGGEPAWDALVEAYFRAHPMHHVDLQENGDSFSPFLVAQGVHFALPPWLAELADLEWWEWRTAVAPDEPAGAGEGPLRLASTLELRPYQHRLAAWLDAEGARPAEPAAGQTVVAFWRDRDLDARRDSATPLELAALHQVNEGAALAPPAGVAAADWDEVIADLHEAGILVGQPGG